MTVTFYLKIGFGRWPLAPLARSVTASRSSVVVGAAFMALSSVRRGPFVEGDP